MRCPNCGRKIEVRGEGNSCPFCGWNLGAKVPKSPPTYTKTSSGWSHLHFPSRLVVVLLVVLLLIGGGYGLINSGILNNALGSNYVSHILGMLGIHTIVDGEVHDISCPSSIEGVKPFTVSIEVWNSGNAEAQFKVEIKSQYLRVTSSPPTKTIAPGSLGAFEFTMKALSTGQPELSSPLNIKVFANGELVDTRSRILKILMPKLEFTRFDIQPATEWFDRWFVFNVNLELSNLGRAAATDVTVLVELDKKGAKRDSYSGRIEYLGPGSSYPITLTLDYEAFDTYQFLISSKCYEGSQDIRKSEEFYAGLDIKGLEPVLDMLVWIIIAAG